jgi:polysaccharide export outer membrane protein
MKRVFLIWLNILFFASSILIAQETGNYVISRNDQVHVFVWQHEDLTASYTVDPDGSIDFNLAGHITVEGKTTSELSELLTERYKKYFRNPIVNVTLSAFRGARFSVIGDVVNPGTFPMSEGYRVSQCLSVAGGPKEDAELDKVIIVRKVEDHGEIHIQLDMESLFDNGMVEQDLMIKDGDIIFVPKKEFDWQQYRWMIMSITATISLILLLIKLG